MKLLVGNNSAKQKTAMSETTPMATRPPSEPPLPDPVSRRSSIFPPSPIDNELRLSTTFAARTLLGMLFAFIGGGILGGYQGSTMASLRFRAENSHRFPTTTTGWYLYHKSKNYHCMLQAIKDGLRFGPRLAGWTGAFFFLEETVDHWRGTRDAFSSAVAALTTSSIFSFKRKPWSKTASLFRCAYWV